MRRRGTWLTCDICLTSSVFVKNLDGYEKSGWKYIRRTKMDICPRCVRAKAEFEKRHSTKLTWDDERQLLYRDRAIVKDMLS